MIPSFVGEGTPAAVTSGTVQPTNPSSLLVDDILVGWMGSGTSGTAFGVPAGWAIEDETLTINARGAWAWRRVAAAGESDDVIDFTQSGNTQQFYAGIFALRGCETSGNPFDSTQNNTCTSCDVATMAAVTTTGVNRKLIHISFVEDNRSAQDNAANYTLQYSGVTTVGSDAAYGVYFQDAATAQLYAADSAGHDGFGNNEHHVEFTIDFKEPGVAGWAGKINGVASPAKINGVAIANISKVSGVSGLYLPDEKKIIYPYRKAA